MGRSEASSHGGKPPPSPGAGSTAAYAAALWSLLFAVASFYWALGGTIGFDTVGPGLAARANDPVFVLVGLWGAGIAKLGGTALALALAARWFRSWQRPLATLSIVGGALAAVYGLASLVQHTAMIADLIPTPAALGATAARWHVLLWDPWWTLGGLLFLAAGREARRHRLEK